jgi:hypothetical protein
MCLIKHRDTQHVFYRAKLDVRGWQINRIFCTWSENGIRQNNVVCVYVFVCVPARARARVYHGWQKTKSVTVARKNFIRTERSEITSRESDLGGGGITV